MVLESILNPLQAEKKPWEMLFIGMLYSSISVLLGIMIFGQDASLVIVFLTVLACSPIMYGAIKMEETKDLEFNSEKKLLKEHSKALSFFMFLFMGIAISYSLWYIFLPTGVSSSVFAIQEKTISAINAQITAQISGQVSSGFGNFLSIFINNFKVLIFCFIFAYTNSLV